MTFDVPESTMDVRDEIRYRYPYPIALTYHNASNAREVVAAHDQRLRLFEVILKYLASVAICQYLTGPHDDPQVNRTLRGLIRPSLGQWNGFLRSVLTYYENANRRDELVVPELYDAYFKRRKDRPAMAEAYNAIRNFLENRTDSGAKSLSARELFDALITYRNKTTGHGVITRSLCEGMNEPLLAGLEELLGGMTFLRDHRLVYVEDVRVKRGHYTHELISYMGSTPPSRLRNAFVVEDANQYRAEERLYLCLRGQNVPALSLHPLVIAWQEDVLFLNESRDRDIEYLSYQTGQIRRPDRLLEDFQDFLGDILTAKGESVRPALPTAPPVTPAEPQAMPGPAVAPVALEEWKAPRRTRRWLLAALGVALVLVVILGVIGSFVLLGDMGDIQQALLPPQPTPTDTPASTATPTLTPTVPAPTHTPARPTPTIPVPDLRNRVPTLIETFDANTRNWRPYYSDGRSRAWIEDGQLHLESHEWGYVGVAWCAGKCGPYQGTYYYQADVDAFTPGDYTYGLAFGMIQASYYVFKIDAYGWDLFKKLVDGKWAELGGGTSSAIRRRDANTLGVHFESGRMTLYVNGEWVGTYTDPNPNDPGRIGVYVDNAAEILADNVLVYQVATVPMPPSPARTLTPSPTVTPKPTSTSMCTPSRPIPTVPVPSLRTKSPAFVETFDSNARGWQSFFPGQGARVWIEGGQLHLEVYENTYIGVAWCTVDCDPYQEPYYYQADVELSTVGQFGHGLAFGITEVSMYVFLIDDTTLHHWSLWEHVGDDWTVLTSGSSPRIDDATANTLGVYVRAGQIDLYINGEMVDTYSGPELNTSGRTGVIIDGAAEILVDNVLVYQVTTPE